MFELNEDLTFLIERIKRYNKAEFDGYHDAAAEYFELLRDNARDFREEGMRIRLQLDQIINNQTGEGAVLITKAWYRYGDGQAWQAFYVWRGCGDDSFSDNNAYHRLAVQIGYCDACRCLGCVHNHYAH